MIPQTLGRYRLVELLGEGGMGRVFLAEDPALGRRVAVKVLPHEFSADPERRARLLHEARAASALNHPNILTIHDLGEEGGSLYVAMERIEGQTLREWAKGTPRPAGEVLRLVRQAARALGVAHAAGLVHRDLKPENLMVRPDGLLKILDFGLARSVTPSESERTATLPGTLLGTAPYMSPEQVLGQAAGPPSDVFSLGTVLYELLTGRHPFEAGTTVDTLHRILHETPAVPSKVNAALGSDFDFVLLKALAKEPGRRHASGRELDVDLDILECGCLAGPAGSAEAAGPGATEAESGPQAIAVLPFKNIGGNPELNYLGIGLADAVITRLSDSPDLIVRATSSVARYENQPVDPRRVAQELDVTAVLDASFQRFGERFRATARLVEAPAGRSLWAGKVDLRFEDIFDVQDQVAHGIAEALTARLAGGAEARAGLFTPSPAAYEAYMRAQEAQRSGTRAGYERAIELGEEAVRLEPRYADAWAQLASTYHGMIDGSFDPNPVWREKTEEALEKALALEPGHNGARFQKAALDLVRGQKRGAYRGFMESHKRAPNNWVLYHYIAYLFRLCDMLDEALLAESRAHELDPSSPWPYWGFCRMHLLRGEPAAAREWMERARARCGPHPRGYSLEIAVLCYEGRYEDAVALSDRLGKDIEDASLGNFERAFALLRLGRTAEAEPFVAREEAFAPVDMDLAAYAAALSALKGDPDRAFRHLGRAVELGNDTLSLYRDDRLFGVLHGDPRWAPFLSAVEERVARFKREFRWPPE